MDDERWITDTRISARFPAWTRGNAADVLPDPVSPLMWTLYWSPALMPALRDGYIRIGAISWDEWDDPNHPDAFGCFGGYFYNPLSLTRLLGARMPGATPELIDKAFFDERPDVPPYVFEAWHESPVHEERLAASMAWAMTATSLPELDQEKALADQLRATRPDLTAVSEAGLIARARSIVPFLQQAMETGMVVSSLASIGPGALGAICEQLGDPTITIRLLAGIEVDSAKPSFAMWDLSRLARASAEVNVAFEAGVDGLLDRLRASGSMEAQSFLTAFADFLHEFGSRGPGEWDIIAKAWEPYPRVALAAIDRMRVSDDAHSPVARHAASVAERDRLVVEVRAKLADDAESLAMFDAAMRSAELFLAGRERYKTNCIKLVGEIRMCALELGRRMVDRGVFDEPEQVFMLLASELDELRQEPERFTTVVRDRQRRYRALFELEPPFAVTGTVPPMSTWGRSADRVHEPVPSGTVLRGACGAGGVATGRACVILDPTDPRDLEPGDILVAPNTDPSWVPLFVPAGAAVVNVGAMGSHAMIVSRDLGIPCVVSVADATERIPDGATITVDGNAGTVTIH
jgi:pyruvate,water dikinase